MNRDATPALSQSVPVGLWRAAFSPLRCSAGLSPLLFVYGTLRGSSDSPWHQRLLAPYAHLVGHGSIAGRIIDLGAYPGLFPARLACDRVPGEVWYLRPETAVLAWRGLDDYEGVAPFAPPPVEYARWCREVRMEDGRLVRAWVYHYLLPPGPALHAN